MTFRGFLLFLVLIGLSFVGLPAAAQAPEQGARPVFERASIAFEKKDGSRVSFDVEVAQTPEQRAYGLMFKKSLGAKEGMIFPLSSPNPVSFWMKDTVLSLDMIFVGPQGAIVGIVQAKPLDRTPIPSGVPVSSVVEVNAGAAEANGLGVGDRLVTPLF